MIWCLLPPKETARIPPIPATIAILIPSASMYNTNTYAADIKVRTIYVKSMHIYKWKKGYMVYLIISIKMKTIFTAYPFKDDNFSIIISFLLESLGTIYYIGMTW